MSDIEMVDTDPVTLSSSSSCESQTASTSSEPALDTSNPHCSDTSPSFDPSLFCPPQRRRVNPESLASRLGPVLVAELEKHIPADSIEMPPFSIRRDIQVNFGIDRRHIYDFYHSRGLRCLKDERPAKKEVFFTEARPRPSRNVAPPSSPPVPEPKRRRVAAVAPAAVSDVPKPVRTARKTKVYRKRPYVMPSQDELAAGHRFSTPEFSALDPEDFASIFNSNQDVSPEDSDLSFAQSFGSAVDPYVLDSVPSISDLPSLLSPSLSEASSLDSSSSLSSFASSSLCSPSATPEPFVFPLDHPFTFPSSLECVQDYTWLDCVLGPALGIQENVGSYKAYMDQQRSIYYEPLLETEAKQSVVAPDPPAPSTEYKSWLSSTKWNIPVPTPQIDKVELSLAQAVYSHCLSPEVLYGFSPYMEIHDQENQTMQHSPKQAVDSAPRTIDICPGELVSCQQSPMAPRKRRESLAFFDPNVIQDPSTATENVMTHERRPSEYMGSPRRHRKEGSRRSFINGGNSWHVRMRTCSGIYTL